MPPRIDIPPLIPVPLNTTEDENKTQEDLFATLFSPPTPRASPVPSAENAATHTETRPNTHQRNSSISSDFGAFVSVPAADDPLALSVPEISPLDASFELDLPEDQTGDTRQPQAQTLGVLDELLHHQDDPLYWIQPSGDSENSRSTTPQPPSMEPTIPEPDLGQLPVLSNEQPMSDMHTDSLLNLLDDNSTQNPPDQEISSSAHQYSSSRFTARRSPTLPQTPSHISEPQVQHTQSFFTPSSISSRWVPSFLASAARSTLSSSPSSSKDLTAHSPERSTSPTSSASPFAPRRFEATLPMTLPSQLKETLASVAQPASHTRAQSLSGPGPALNSARLDAFISHGTPFSSHPYVPPLGAPGFGGDRTWDKGFEFDQAGVESKSVKLLGRKELTTPVLTSELADLVRHSDLARRENVDARASMFMQIRPQFPALARLHRSWNLLYSLDQHGISLHTLYARCDAHAGSTLVVIQDAGDAVFGAWMGEGVHPHRGGYFGSGESYVVYIPSIQTY